jgi:hypothetical protein
MLPPAITLPGVIKLAAVTLPVVELLTLPVMLPVTNKLPMVTSAMLAVLVTVSVLLIMLVMLATLPTRLLTLVLPSTVKLVKLPNDVTLG